jgi:hypothetical protein
MNASRLLSLSQSVQSPFPRLATARRSKLSMRFLLPIPPNVLPLYRSKMQGSSAWMTLSSAPTPLNLKAIPAKSPPSN